MKIKLTSDLFRKFKNISHFLQKSAKLAIFGWSNISPPERFAMYIFLPTIWWSFVLLRKNAQMLQFPAQLANGSVEYLMKKAGTFVKIGDFWY